MTKNTDREGIVESRRRLLLGAGGVAAASMLRSGLVDAQKNNLEARSIKVGIGPDFGTSGHAVIALEKGFFKSVGFEKVEMKIFAAGLVQLEALAAGGIDIALPTQTPVFSLRSAGVPVVVFSSLAAYNESLGLVARKELNIKRPSDFYGKKIGVLKGSGAEMMVNAFIKHYNLDTSKIATVNLAPPEQMSAIATGAVDAICVWQPWVYQASQKIPVDIVSTGATSHFAENRGERVTLDWTRGLAATLGPFIQKHPGTIDAFVQALAMAQSYVASPKNFDDVNTTFSRFHNQSTEANAVIIRGYGPSLAFDKRFLEDLVEVQDFLIQSGRVKKKTEPADILYGNALRKIDPQLVSIEARWKR
ncbi:MAG: ABC transporter substrate-binding protein [Burkholderiales bacterium]|nr:ABC transporter substrate-binding protein [Burkholderiales bacterium]